MSTIATQLNWGSSYIMNDFSSTTILRRSGLAADRRPDGLCDQTVNKDTTRFPNGRPRWMTVRRTEARLGRSEVPKGRPHAGNRYRHRAHRRGRVRPAHLLAQRRSQTEVPQATDARAARQPQVVGTQRKGRRDPRHRRACGATAGRRHLRDSPAGRDQGPRHEAPEGGRRGLNLRRPRRPARRPKRRRRAGGSSRRPPAVLHSAD